VQVVGFGHLEFEGDALYLHREDLTANLVPNSVRLDIPHASAFAAFNDRYVIVEGVFVAAKGEGSPLRPGSITRISRYDPLPSHAELHKGQRPQH
jgi:hypothetical protein